MRLFFALFTYFLPVDIRPSKWLHELSSPQSDTLKTKKEKQKNDNNEESLDEKKSHLRSTLQLWEHSDALEAELRLGKSFWPAMGARAALVASCTCAAALSLTTRSFTASDSYTWYCLLTVASFFVWNRLKERTQSTLIFLADSLQVKLLQVLPYRVCSRKVGQICNMKLNPRYRTVVYKFLIFLWKIDMAEAVDEVPENFDSIGDLFRRPIKPHLRPIHSTSEVVCPVDGTIMQVGAISQGAVEQVKGITYSLKNFLGPLYDQDVPLQKYARCLMRDPRKNVLYSCVTYLAPRDYHRFHSPTEWRMEQRRHFVGNLLSVNPRIARLVPGLFVINERVVLSGKWKHGFFSMTAVGATSVGSIVVYDDKNLQTNPVEVDKGTYFDHTYEDGGVLFSRGDSVGEFRLGSTVVLIFEAPKNYNFAVQRGSSMKYGQAVASSC